MLETHKAVTVLITPPHTVFLTFLLLLMLISVAGISPPHPFHGKLHFSLELSSDITSSTKLSRNLHPIP